MQQALVVNVGGIGTALDTSNLASSKIIEITGLGVGDSLEIEVSTDGVNFNPAKKFTQANNIQRLNYPVAAIRVDATNSTTGGITATVDADVGNTRSQIIPVPALDAVGASVDISDLGPLSACSVNNLVPAGSEVRFEVSENDVDFKPLHTFDADDCVVKNISHKFIRAVSVGAISADLSIVADSSSSAISQTTFVFRPGATGADAPGGNVYTDFPAVMAALDATTHLGQRTLEFDSRHSNDRNLNLRDDPQVCLIPDGDWDMHDVTLSSCNEGTDSPHSIRYVLVQFLGTAKFLNLHDIDAENLFFIGDSLTTSPIPLYEHEMLRVTGLRVQFTNTVVGAAPLFEIIESHAFMGFNAGQNSEFGSFSLRQQPVEPLIHVPAPAFFAIQTEGAGIGDNMITGDVGARCRIFNSSMRANAFGQIDMPGFLGSFLWVQNVGCRMMIDHDTLTENGSLYGQELNRADTTIAGTVDGAGATISFAELAGEVTMTDTGAAFDPALVGRSVTVALATSAGNDGRFVITAVTPTTLVYANAAGVTEAGPAGVTYEAALVATLPLAGPTYSNRTVVKDVGGQAGVLGKSIIVAVEAGNYLDGVLDGTTVINTAYGTVELGNEAGFAGDGLSWWII